jgi:hypothetical protein
LTVATAKFVTVMIAVPLFPSLVAVIVVVPAATAVRLPDDEMVATPVLLELHSTGRPDNKLPASSRSKAVSPVVCPTDMDNGFGVTATDATGACVTVIVATSFLPSAVAVIDAVPGPVAVTSPSGSTVATPVLLLDQMIARSVSGFWPPS